MGLELLYIKGQTSLSEQEKEGLLIGTISTREELDEHEQLNIEKAVAWTIQLKHGSDKILTEEFIKKLHRKMFSEVWSWAGEFRKSEKNLGVKWIEIRVALKSLLDDTKYWLENKVYLPDELAIRFKHRIVKIHCFPNGNGRHSRIMADIIIESIFDETVFSWNHSNIVEDDKTRSNYIAALHAGDNGDIEPLIEFARS